MRERERERERENLSDEKHAELVSLKEPRSKDRGKARKHRLLFH